MKQKSGPGKAPAEQVLKDIRRQTRRQYSAEDSRVCATTVPSLKGLGVIFYFTQRFRAGLTSLAPAGLAFCAICSTEPSRDDFQHRLSRPGSILCRPAGWGYRLSILPAKLNQHFSS